MRFAWIWLVVGVVAHAMAFGFAVVVGSGAGHGSDAAALITLAPISLFSNPIEQNNLLPFFSFAAWGVLFRLAWAGRTRRQVLLGGAMLGIHVISGLMVFGGEWTRYVLIPLTPHLFVVTATSLAIVVRWFRVE